MDKKIIDLTVSEFKSLLIEVFKEDQSIKKSFDLMTRKEVKTLLSIDYSTLYLWTKKGILKSYGIGNRIYYKRAEIEEALIFINHNGEESLINDSFNRLINRPNY